MKIDGRHILKAEELISPFKLNYNCIVSEHEAGSRRGLRRAKTATSIRDLPDADREFDYFLAQVR